MGQISVRAFAGPAPIRVGLGLGSGYARTTGFCLRGLLTGRAFCPEGLMTPNPFLSPISVFYENFSRHLHRTSLFEARALIHLIYFWVLFQHLFHANFMRARTACT